MREVRGDKRGLERFELEIPARIRVSGFGENKESLDLNTSDISSGGAFFHTSQPLAEGTDVQVDLILPIDKLIQRLEKIGSDYRHTCIKISGTVLRAESKGMAIGFNSDYEMSLWQGDKISEN